MGKQRASQFEREPDRVGGIRLTDRDVRIVRLVHDYRFLNSRHIQLLTEGSDQQVLRRLQKLFHHGYLDRPPRQGMYPLPGLEKMVYALGDKGADLLAERFGYDRGKVRWKDKNKRVKRRYLLHTLMISNFRVCLTKALEEAPKAKIGFWKREKQADLKDSVLVRTQGGSSKEIPIVPDSYFAIEKEGRRAYFFLEADRSTMTNRRFLRKMRGYWKWWEKGGHTQKFDIQAFRVLTVTPTEKRMQNLKKTTRKADDRKQGSQMFWFTSEERYGLEKPTEVLKPIWETPKEEDREAHQLLE